jgi:integrase
MKAGREHQVPLSDRAVVVLRTAKKWAGESEWIFPGQRGNAHLSNMALLKLRNRLGRRDITIHGFRSTFRDWAQESEKYDRLAIEFSLAHSLPNRVEAAYLRTKMLRARRELMSDWASYCVDRLLTPLKRAA